MKSYSNFDFRGGYFISETNPDRYLTIFDVESVQDDDERDNISSPSDGQLIITKHDFCINIYDDSQSEWIKIHSKKHLTHEYIGGNIGFYLCGTYGYVLSISTGGNYDKFTYTDIDRRYSAIASNGPVGRVIVGGGNIDTSLGTNLIDYTSIITLNEAIDFGELFQTRRNCHATSNNINNRAVFAGHQEDQVGANSIEYVTISSTSNGVDFGDMNVIRMGPTMISNGSLNKAVIVAGWQYAKHPTWVASAGGDPWCFGTETITTIDYIDISTPNNATNFGEVTYWRWWGDGCSNLQYNIGIRSPGFKWTVYYTRYALWNYWNCLQTVYRSGSTTIYYWRWWETTEIDYFKINTPSDAYDFGDLTWAKQNIGISSNGIRNRAVMVGYNNSNNHWAEVINLLARTGTAELHTFIDEAQDHCRGTSNA